MREKGGKDEQNTTSPYKRPPIASSPSKTNNNNYIEPWCTFLKEHLSDNPLPHLASKTMFKCNPLSIQLLPDQCLVGFVRNFLDAKQCQELIDEIESSLQFESRVNGFGIPIPRQLIWIGDSSSSVDAVAESIYGSNTSYENPITMPPLVSQLKDRLNTILHTNLNSVLINKYRKDKIFDAAGNWVAGAGKDSIMKHRDREVLQNESPIIVSVSLGSRRTFLIEHSKTKQKLKYELGHGDLLIMGYQVNVHCTHEVPKEPLLQMKHDRINMTFRQV